MSSTTALYTALFLLLTTVALSAADGPQVSIEPLQSPFLASNDPAENKQNLSCVFEGDPSLLDGPPIWTGPNRTDNFEEVKLKQNYTSGQDKISSTLAFASPLSAFQGTYYCIAQLKDGSTVSNSRLVRFYMPIVVNKCEERQVLKIARPGQIICQFRAEDSRVFLFKDGKIAGPRYRIDGQLGVAIDQVENSDAGNYTINIKSKVTGSLITRTISVSIFSAPYFDKDTETSHHFLEGNSANLSCVAYGIPQPNYDWLDSKNVSLVTNEDFVVDRPGGTLYIRNVTRLTDFGNIQCLANNTEGQARQNFSFVIMGKPDSPSTSAVIAVLVFVLVVLVLVDIIFCACCQIGATNFIRNSCCPSKTTSVNSDTTTSDKISEKL